MVSLGVKYVYAHLIDDVIFYIGKGDLNRAYSYGARNKIWKSLVQAAGYFSVKIISEWPSDIEARANEFEQIKLHNPIANIASIHKNPKYSRLCDAIESGGCIF